MIFDWLDSNEILIQSALAASLMGFSFQVALRSGVETFAGVGCWAIGGYTAGLLLKDGWATVPAIGAAVLAAALTGVLLAVVLARLRGLYLAMVTIAFILVIQVAAQTLHVTGGPNGLFSIPIVTGTGTLAAIVAVCAVVLWRRERGATGRMLAAMHRDEQLAVTLGVNVRLQRMIVFVLSSVLGALSGASYATMFSTLSPNQAGFELLVATLTIVVIGGTSSWVGPVIGAFVVTWLPELLTVIGDWWPAVQGVIVALMVLFAPDGVVGLAKGLRRRIAREGWRGAFGGRFRTREQIAYPGEYLGQEDR